MATLEEIRNKLKKLEQKSENSYDNSVFAHWNIDFDKTCTVRFLPDKDENNTFFWIEKLTINLTFPGVLGEDTKKEVRLQVPCMEMYGDQCPILTEIRPWFNDPSLEPLARKYWKKRSYIMQGFVQDAGGLVEERTPDSPIRRFMLSPQIFKLVKGALLDPELVYNPTHYTNGLDFRITKTKDGQYADYATSTWSRRESALTVDQLESIEKHGLENLVDYLPSKPDAKAVSVIKEMFEASVNGELYDFAKWGSYFKPHGMKSPQEQNAQAPSTQAPSATRAPAPSVTENVADDKSDTIPFDAAPETSSQNISPSQSSQNILETLRNRNKKAAESN